MDFYRDSPMTPEERAYWKKAAPILVAVKEKRLSREEGLKQSRVILDEFIESL